MGGHEQQAVSEAHGPDAPRVLHHLDCYRVLGRLGVGGMAEVFLARDEREPRRRAVIKRVRPSIANDAAVVEMFLDEARIFMRLRHPNICRFYDAAYVDGEPCVAMEHIDGVTLDALIEAAARYGGIPRALALRIARDVASALDTVHGLRDESGTPLNVVHRDVTPRNIMIGFDGRVCLLDFGLAKAALSPSRTRPGMAKGMLAYLAPEVFLGVPAGPAADIFALGVCLFEALTGRPLYRFARMSDTCEAIVEAPVPSLRARQPSAPAALDGILRRALAKDPATRQASAAQLVVALDELGSLPSSEVLATFVASVCREERASGPPLEPTEFGRDWSACPDAQDLAVHAGGTR